MKEKTRQTQKNKNDELTTISSRFYGINKLDVSIGKCEKRETLWNAKALLHIRKLP